MPAPSEPVPVQRQQGGTRFVRSALRRFAVWSAVALLVLIVAAGVIGSHIAQQSALQEARLRGGTIAASVAAPLVDERVRAGDEVALYQLGRVMRARMADGDLVRVKLWSDDGTILWSDQGSLIGQRFPLEEEVEKLFGTRGVTAEISDLDKAENVGERTEGELLEVYAGALDADAEAMVFEAYISTERMERDQRRIVLSVLPLTIGGLLLFHLTVLPLAVSLARRVQEGESERVRIMHHALQSTAQERRRIAGDLHDGVIQDLAGLSYAMPEVGAHLPDTPEAAGARQAVARAVEILRRDVSSLRSMLVDIYPPDLRGSGFVNAIEDLARRARAQGVDVDVQIPADYDEAVDANRLAYRVVQEGLRNVVKHSGATHALVTVERQGRRVRVAVRDDGVGIQSRPDIGSGHLGLVLLEEGLRDFGGTLEARPLDGGGTLLEASFPTDLREVFAD